jgi:uncharacterized iron-regulated membrane protein
MTRTVASSPDAPRGPRPIAVFWSVHAWSGVLVSLIVCAMFIGGGFSLFLAELKAWQDPPAAATSLADIDAAVARVFAGALPGGRLDVALPGRRHAARAELRFDDARGEQVLLATGELSRPRSRVAEALYQLHILYHEAFPLGFHLAGVISALLLLALVTGVAIQLKLLVGQLFRFRPAAPPRHVAGDLHKVLGVWGLPFQLMIAFTGAVMCTVALVGQNVGAAAFDGTGERALTELYADYSSAPPAGVAAAVLPVSALVARAEAEVPGMAAWWIRLSAYRDANAQAMVFGEVAGQIDPRVLVRLRATDGALIDVQDLRDTAGQATMRALSGLHFATFGGLALKLVYALLTLGGVITILSGTWIWLARRARGGRRRGDQVLGSLTLGVGAGLPIAIAVMLWINRLVPAAPGRGTVEVWGMFGAWGLVLAGCLALPHTRRSWARLLAIAGAGFAAVPVLSIATQQHHLANAGGAMGWTIAGVDLGFALLGVALLAIAIAIGRGRARHAVGELPSRGRA